MTRKRILVADNDEHYLDELSALLRREGFAIETASNPGDARRILDAGRVEMAIVDLRLADDSDRRDVTGLVVARDAGKAIPKVILTAYRPDNEVLVEALQPGSDGLSPAVRFVLKSKGDAAVLQAVHESMRLPRFRQGLDELWNYIFDSHAAAQQQATDYFRLSLGLAAAGGLAILLGLGLLLAGSVSPGLYSAGLGTLTDAVGILVYRQAQAANARADRFHDELLGMRYVENLLAACEEYEMAEDVQAAVIHSAANYWLGQATLEGGRK